MNVVRYLGGARDMNVKCVQKRSEKPTQETVLEI